MSQTNAYGRHEILHVACVMQDMFARHVMEHAATRMDPAVEAAAERAMEALADFYQACGAAFVGPDGGG